MKAIIDRDGCIGCTLCAGKCPDVFRMADDGLAEAYQGISPENAALAREAADACPVSVIDIEE